MHPNFDRGHKTWLNRTTAPVLGAGLWTILSVFVGCAASSPSATPDGPLDNKVASLPAPSTGRAPLIVNGDPVPWTELQAILAEAAGTIAVEEAALNRLLIGELARANLQVTESDLDAESARLLDAARDSAPQNAQNASDVLDRVRRERGLGPTRFRALLYRTAALRKLVAPGVSVDESELDLAARVRFGPRVQVRAIVVPSEREAAEIVRGLAGDPASLDARFAAAALTRSRDPSAPRGGLLEPISPADPGYPAAMRSALERLRTNELSPIIALERGFAVLLLVERIEAPPAPDAAQRAQLSTDLRVRKERLAMDGLARQLLTRGISVIDPGLGWNWDQRAPGN